MTEVQCTHAIQNIHKVHESKQKKFPKIEYSIFILGLN